MSIKIYSTGPLDALCQILCLFGSIFLALFTAGFVGEICGDLFDLKSRTEEIIFIVLMVPLSWFYSMALAKLRFMLEDFFKNKN